jgi:ribose transport system ATP-binding protein
MRLDGHIFKLGDKKAAEHAGVRIVLQELSLIDNLSVAKNLFLRQLPHRGGWIRRNRLADAAH